MPIYLEILEDEQLLAMSTGFESIVIVACGACPNESLAYARGIPLAGATITEEGQSKSVPCAITQEAGRLAELFRSRGFAVRIRVLAEEFLCLLSDTKCDYLREKIPSSEAILALCCSAGVQGLKAITRTSMPLLLGMVPRALFFYQYRIDPNLGTKWITHGQLVFI